MRRMTRTFLVLTLVCALCGFGLFAADDICVLSASALSSGISTDAADSYNGYACPNPGCNRLYGNGNGRGYGRANGYGNGSGYGYANGYCDGSGYGPQSGYFAGSYDGSADMFWEQLSCRMSRTEKGGTITVLAQWRSSMPAYMFDNIRDSGVNLIICWDGGADIHINAQELPRLDENILSYDFSEIIEMI